MSRKLSIDTDQTGSPALESLAEQVRTAREVKGLSQRGLSERTGIPQSHISKIENAGSDIRISSLLSLAHALDLELRLVPRKLVPLLENLQGENASPSRRIPQDVMRTLSEIDALESLSARILREFDSEDFAEAEIISILHDTLRELTRIHMSSAQAKGIWDRIQHLKRPLSELKSLVLGYKIDAKSSGSYHSMLKNIIGTITPIARDLRDLRNRFFHEMGSDDLRQRPAYQLDDEEEDDG
ncbi:MAG: helix-turn-helix transcriptional regulator [Parvularculaceae bacterium]